MTSQRATLSYTTYRPTSTISHRNVPQQALCLQQQHRHSQGRGCRGGGPNPPPPQPRPEWPVRFNKFSEKALTAVVSCFSHVEKCVSTMNLLDMNSQEQIGNLFCRLLVCSYLHGRHLFSQVHLSSSQSTYYWFTTQKFSFYSNLFYITVSLL